MAELVERLSAQVIASVSDYSRLDVTPESAALGVITATKGPVDELHLIQTTTALVNTFGEPSADHISLCAAYKIIAAGNAMYLVRVGHESSMAAASAVIAGTRKEVTVPANATVSEPASGVTAAISASPEGSKIPSGISGIVGIVGTYDSQKTSYSWNVSLAGHTLETAFDATSNVLTIKDLNLAVTFTDSGSNLPADISASFEISVSQSETETANVLISTKELGTYGNAYSVKVATGTTAGTYEITLFEGSLTVEKHLVSLNPSSDDYILNLNAENFNLALETEGVAPDALTPTTDNTSLTGGADGLDGITGSDYIGQINPSTGEATGSKLFLQPKVVAQMYPSLGVTDKTYLAGMKAISDEKKYITCVYDTPVGLTLNEACNWLNNGTGSEWESDTTVLEGWNCEVYWPWETDSYNGYPLVMPPSTYVTINSMDCFRRIGPQLPVAGNPRGIISGVGVTTQIPSATDRDKLVTNRINPIWDTGINGVQIYGNETLNNDYTDLRSAHIARMLAQIVTSIDRFTEGLEFELNDSLTWQRWIDGATQILQVYKDKRGLNWFGLKMGLDTTTAKEIAQRQIRGQIGLQFVQDAEVFWLNYAVFASSATDIDF